MRFRVLFFFCIIYENIFVLGNFELDIKFFFLFNVDLDIKVLFNIIGVIFF